MYKRAKAEFRHVQQAANEQYMQNCYDDLNETAECDVRLFWKQIKRFKGCSSKVYPEIVYEDKVCNTPESVANCFAEYFHDLYQPNDEDNFDNEFKCYIETTYNEIIKTCGVEGEYLPGGLITEQEVSELIGQLKYRKAAGHDRVQNEHLRQGEYDMSFPSTASSPLSVISENSSSQSRFCTRRDLFFMYTF
ncbi:unnamed protein product [Mytilus coruscus]|uniref:Uncharacterized protein n=1 Tax=Mytilus coruscus TaxID=42192 RepID=A0A6J8BDM2_MYTCO|nr:unnamed protein product [Mytilus coruscus]